MAKSVSDGSSSDEPSSSQASGVSSGSGTGNTAGAESTSDSSFSLARSETRLVNRSKMLVFGVITLAAGLLGCMIFLLLTQEETTTFHIEFTNHAEEIIELLHFEAQSAFQSINTLSVLITSMALNRNDSWPNITVPHFELRGVEINKLGNADQTTFVPLVRKELRQEWEAYAQESQGWLNESLYWQEELVVHNKTQLEFFERDLQDEPKIPKKLWGMEDGESGTKVPLSYDVDPKYGYFAPVWQQVPAPGGDSSILNYDLMSRPDFQRLYHGLWESRLPVLSESMDVEWLTSGALADHRSDPKSLLMTPVYSFFSVKMHERDDLVGLLVSVIHWKNFFEHLLVEGVNGFELVLSNTCDGTFTYTINGPEAIYKGPGDLHDTRYSSLGVESPFAPFLKHNFSDTSEHCEYDVVVYPTVTLDDSYHTNKPALYTSIVLLVFFFTAMVFLLYDYLVQQRQNKVMATAKRTNAIVSSLFPSNVRDRILRDAEEQAEIETREKKAFGGAFAKNKFKDLLNEGDLEAGAAIRQSTKPIADLYPEVTVMFGDIVGFTAWSSVREPAQVFTLLETLFASFDEIADRRRVFKVETVGDCYVAVAGLPDPRKDHAVVMARFARDVLYKMNDLTKRLEVELGPDTADLSLRVGLHSGQVTAGVLRGDKSRFQLFGDTMNTCSRIESTGERNKIHISAETAACLHALGKGNWVQERDDIITAKGKGNLQTYWLNFRPQSAPSTRSGSSENDTEGGDDPQKVLEAQKMTTTPQSSYGNDMVVNARTARLIEWNVDVLKKVLQQIRVRRVALGSDKEKFEDPQDSFDGSILEEVKEIIRLPNFNSSIEDAADKDPMELDPNAIEQLRAYITMISQLYRENPFHCFEHASHVTMSVTKLLSRIVAPDGKNLVGKDDEGGNIAARLHDHTYGITSDPLTQFACIFAALIHDVDHQGVPNTQLMKENATIAAVYNNKSIAEQNSLDIAWELLMDPQFVDLRAAIYTNKSEYYHFRQLLVNAVMATDIMDKDAGAFRKQRWEKAFSEQAKAEETTTPSSGAASDEPSGGGDGSSSSLDAVNRKATIVIEHLIQASDVAHTMQHWHIYSKWNERLFEEMYRAYRQGRADKDPSESWYAGEIGFFDYYVIPLAKKLKACGVFGVSSDEYLNYAVSNRKEWEAVGRERVETMVAKYAPALPAAAVAAAEES